MKHLIAFLLLTPALLAADFSGIWFHSTKAADGHTVKMALVLTQSGTQLSGKVKLPWGDVAITQGSVDGRHFTLTANESTWFNLTAEGALEGGKLHFTVHENKDKPYDVVAERTTTDPFVIPNIAPPPAVKDLAPNGLAKTPPMGWNSWNLFAGKIDDKTVREMADALVTSGMRDAGYIYLNIDDTWEGDRDANGVIQTNNKFPDMKALADYVHTKGLKFGIYSSPGPYTCAGYEGSYAHEAQDAKTYATWGIDYLKYDWCSAGRLYKDDAMRAVYQKMAEALQATLRPIVYSLCQYGRDDVWTWAPEAGGNLWRSTGDISDNWKSMIDIAERQSAIAQYAGLGHWNDPDMLEIGNGGMTTDEYRTHMSLWAMFAAPLLAGNDVRTMSADTKSILLNKEVIAIDQDPLGKPGQLAFKRGDVEYWKRELSATNAAIAVVNRGDASTSVKIPWADLGVADSFLVFKEVWSGVEVVSKSESAFTIPAHGVVLLTMEMVH